MTTESRFVELNQPAPNFTLPAVDGSQVSLADFQGKKHVVLVFLPRLYVTVLPPAFGAVAPGLSKIYRAER